MSSHHYHPPDPPEDRIGEYDIVFHGSPRYVDSPDDTHVAILEQPVRRVQSSISPLLHTQLSGIAGKYLIFSHASNPRYQYIIFSRTSNL